MSENAQVTERPDVFINRELSWLDFARRVLELAEDREAPLLERVKFAGIMGMIYDEFSMKRIGGLRHQVERKGRHTSADGLTPVVELQLCREELNRQTEILRRLVTEELRPGLLAAGVPILDYGDLDQAQGASADAYYRESVEPILTPLSVDIGHPFPFISNLSMNLAVTQGRPGKRKWRFIRVKVPPNRPRWVPVAGAGYVPLEQVMAHNLHRLLPDGSDWSYHFFRVTRGAKDDPWDRLPQEDDHPPLGPGSLIGMVSAELTARRFAGVVRLQVSDGMPEEVRAWLAGQLHTELEDTVVTGGLLATADLLQFQAQGLPELRDAPHVPVTHPRLTGLDPDDTEEIFREIRAGDILLHHPYHNFDTSVLRFLESAARDSQVLAIKLTIYRTSKGSPI
ncbi:MAG: RNA degradosome polyphosphate kinase, partial [Gemmatimonadota bacterium]